jgi:hypothetical protein
MAQETLALIAVSTPDGFTLGAGASKVAAVALPDDGDASYISAALNNTEEKFQVAAPAVVTANDAINFVRVVTVARSTSTLASFFTKLFYSASTSTGATRTNVPTSYTTLNDDYALAPDGGAWTLTKLQSLFASVRMAANRDMRVTSLYVVVDYTGGQNVSASGGAPGTDAASSSAIVSTGESGAGVEARSVAPSVSVGEQLPAEAVIAAANVTATEVGGGADSLSLSGATSAGETGAGSVGRIVGAVATVAEAWASSDEAASAVSASVSEEGVGAEASAVGVEVSSAEQGAGLLVTALGVSTEAGELGAGYETVSAAAHTFATIHGGAHVSNESGRTRAAVTASNAGVGLLESDGRTSAEV